MIKDLNAYELELRSKLSDLYEEYTCKVAPIEDELLRLEAVKSLGASLESLTMDSTVLNMDKDTQGVINMKGS